MTTITTDFETRFRPTADQILFAMDYLAESGLSSVMVSVNFPGKQSGIWEEGQVVEPVMDRGEPMIWTDRDSALFALDTGSFGNALFRVYANGHCHLVDEKR